MAFTFGFQCGLRVANHSKRYSLPELPEVETVRRGLAPIMEEAFFSNVEQNRPDLRFPFPDRFSERLVDQNVEKLDRRAKFLLARLSSGESLLMHLGMSGRFTIEEKDQHRTPGEFAHAPRTNPKHDHVVFTMSQGGVIRFNDPRRFGFMTLMKTNGEGSHPFLAPLGPEPNGNQFNATYLSDALKDRRTPIKTALLDQSIVAGLGNIYVCEALWRAGISPRRLARSIPGKRAERLTPAIRDVITEAIAAGGSSLRDFASASGELGYFQHRFDVYGRQGQNCRREKCDGLIQRLVQSGRSSFYCSHCQR